MARRKDSENSKKASNGKTKNGNGPLAGVKDFRYEATKRKNIPPAKIAAEGVVPLLPKAEYFYSSRRPPKLQFDPTGKPDQLPELLAMARQRALNVDEANELAEALRDQEPWLEWAGKREARKFEVDPIVLQIHERISAKAILKVAARQDVERSLFADPQQAYHEAVQFYRHDIDWTNRLILGDSLQVMSSLARREDLAGKVQMIYIDPPYGIRFASNFQPKIGDRDVKDRDQDLTREPEMVKAYRDTWHLGIHSYLTYLRDRLIAAREMLSESGSVFVQIGDENLQRVRQVLDEVFGAENCASIVVVWKTSSATSALLPATCDYLLWYARSIAKVKYTQTHIEKDFHDPSSGAAEYKFAVLPSGEKRPVGACSEADLTDALLFRPSPTTSQSGSETTRMAVMVDGEPFTPGPGGWKTNAAGFSRLYQAERLMPRDKSISYVRYLKDFPVISVSNLWTDARWGFDASEKRYVVETNPKVIARCILMTTDPGDLVLDPTCGSGTTAYVAEQLGRRWITIDTSRVAIALARQRLLTAKFDFYQLRPLTSADQTRNPSGVWITDPTDQIQGPVTFKCKTVPHVTLKSIAQSPNLDPIFAKHEPILEEKLVACNVALARIPERTRQNLTMKLMQKQKAEGRKAITDADRRRWELPVVAAVYDRRPDAVGPGGHIPPLQGGWEHWQVPFDTDPEYPKDLADVVTEYRKAWRAKMDEVNACIAANAEQEELVDQPEVAKGMLRVSGPFTVEAVQPPEMMLGDVEVIDLGEGKFGGEPEELDGTFAVREVEARTDLEAKNIEAYLEQMIRLLRMDGVRFPDNKQMRFTRLEQLRVAEPGLQAEGRWVPEKNGAKDKDGGHRLEANGGHRPPLQEDADPEGKATVCVAFGPQYGPVTAKMVEDVIRSANRMGYDDLVIAGFSFDGPAQAVIEEAQRPKLRIHAAHIRPDVNPGMNGLLKEQPGSQLFTVFGQPRTRVRGPDRDGQYTVTMEGVDIYNPVDNSITSTGADKVAAWFLDGDYDGRTFCITQAFFPDKTAWGKLSKALENVVDPERFAALSGTVSLPFPAGKHKSAAVKVIDPRGNEVMQVHKL